MVAIKNFDMPSGCSGCNFCQEDRQLRDYCAVSYEDLRWVKAGERHENCPLVEIETKTEDK